MGNNVIMVAIVCLTIIFMSLIWGCDPATPITDSQIKKVHDSCVKSGRVLSVINTFESSRAYCL